MKNLFIFLLSFACVSLSTYGGQWQRAKTHVASSNGNRMVALSCSTSDAGVSQSKDEHSVTLQLGNGKSLPCQMVN